MAKYANGVNYAKTLDPTSANIIDPGLLGGKIRVMKDYASVTSQLSSSGYIVVGGLLPTGAQVIQTIVGGSMTAFASSSNIHVGDEGDADRYLTSVSCAANVVTVGPNVSGGMYYTVTGVTDNYLRLSTAIGSTTLSGADVKVSVMYVVE